jgi:hypothetical protein
VVGKKNLRKKKKTDTTDWRVREEGEIAEE